jgi:hypothetical protein
LSAASLKELNAKLYTSISKLEKQNKLFRSVSCGLGALCAGLVVGILVK